ncbi:MAG: four helix bundle protein, partial [Chitinophagaceae bacterium]|nr:four helix bundle protein [Chitinophagaceae bacterium]
SKSEKETRETPYWLNLLTNSKFFITDELVEIKNYSYEIIRMLNSIILSKNKKVFQKIFITLKS